MSFAHLLLVFDAVEIIILLVFQGFKMSLFCFRKNFFEEGAY